MFNLTADGRLALPSWLPKQAGHTGLKFSNGLEMAHDEASRACDHYVKNHRHMAEYVATPEVNRTIDSKTGKYVYTPKPAVTIKTDELSDKSILNVMGAKNHPVTKSGQPLHFDNGTSVSHSDASRACADFVRKVEAGKKNIPGLTAEFTGINGEKLTGIQKPGKKIQKLLAS